VTPDSRTDEPFGNPFDSSQPEHALVALAIVVATPAAAGQLTQPTKHESPAGELAFSVDAAGAQLNLLVRRPMKNNLNGDYKPAVCLDIGISLDLPTRCWGDRL
jgi:hypothetical protein